MMYPLTEILKPGPISKGIEENRALFATALELMEERSDVSSEIPPLVKDAGAPSDTGAVASGSVGIAL